MFYYFKVFNQIFIVLFLVSCGQASLDSLQSSENSLGAPGSPIGGDNTGSLNDEFEDEEDLVFPELEAFSDDGILDEDETDMSDDEVETVDSTPPSEEENELADDDVRCNRNTTASLYSGNFGNGSKNNPWKICSYSQLNEINSDSPSLPSLSQRMGGHYVQMRNINAIASNDTPFNSIGKSIPFSGHYNGKKHKIKNLVIECTQSGPTGLFAKAASATIKRVRLKKVRVDAENCTYVGALVGQSSNSKIQNVRVAKSVIIGSRNVGGMLGSASGNQLRGLRVMKSTVKGSSFYVGGIAGSAGEIYKSKFYGTIEGGSFATGGIAGSAGFVTKSRSKGKLIGASHSLGGIIGQGNGARIEHCYSEIEIDAERGSHSIGGILGQGNGSNTKNNHFAGMITAPSAHSVGGVVGQGNGASISNSFSNGTVNGGSMFGGLIGQTNGAKDISNSFSTALLGQGSSWGAGVVAGQANGARGSNLAFWVHEENISNRCIGQGSNISCTEETDQTVFFNEAYPVFSTWDKSSVWSFSGDSLPKLKFRHPLVRNP